MNDSVYVDLSSSLTRDCMQCGICLQNDQNCISRYIKTNDCNHGPFHGICLARCFQSESQIPCPICRQDIFFSDQNFSCIEKLCLRIPFMRKLPRLFFAMFGGIFNSDLLYSILDIVVITLLAVWFGQKSKVGASANVLPIIFSIAEFFQIFSKYRHFWGGYLSDANATKLLTYEVGYFFEGEEVGFLWQKICSYGWRYRLFFIVIGLLEMSIMSLLIKSY